VYTLTSKDAAVGMAPGRFLFGKVDAATALDSAFAWFLTPTPLPGDNYGLPDRPWRTAARPVASSARIAQSQSASRT
jgi:hypothetical protein